MYNSYFYEFNTAGIDAFAQLDWDVHLNFCNRPFSQMGRLTNYIMYHVPNAPIILVAPYWTGAPWFESLWNTMDDIYLLPHQDELFIKI